MSANAAPASNHVQPAAAPLPTTYDDNVIDVDFDEIDSLLGLPATSPADPVDDDETPEETIEEVTPAATPPEEETDTEATDDETDTTEEDPASTEEEEATEDEPEAKKSDLPAGVQKRIDKLTARAKTAETELTTLKAERDTLKEQVGSAAPVTFQPTAAAPLADVQSAEDLEARVSHARSMKSWALENLEGAEVRDPSTGDTKYYEPSQVRKILANAESLIDAAPKRQQWLENSTIAEQQAREAYPEMYEPGSETHKAVQQVAKAMPQLLSFPNWRLIVGDALIGGMVRAGQLTVQAAEEKKAAAAADKKPALKGAPKLAPRTPDAPARRTTPAEPVERAEQVRKQAAAAPINDRHDLESFVESIL